MKNKKKLSFKSKNILVIMTIFCVAMLLFAYTARLPLDSVQSVAGYAVVPFQKGINGIGNWIYGRTRGFEDVRTLQQENEELRQKVDTLTEQNNLLLQDQDKLERFENLYALDMDYAEYDKVAASVISKDPGNWYNTFTIDKGTKDGIAVDMNVIAGGGLCGIVTEAGSDWATVRSIIDDSSNVSAMVSSTLDNCLVTGDLTLIEDGKLNFIQLSDPDDLVTVGDKIVTSNISDKFLKGILIGYISEVNYDSNNLTKYGYLIPVVDFRHLQEVLVIKELKKTGEKK
ncbi:MAG TPA: rod shape-determining protein MreC [Lachnospiraceae bacterium]|nr:rod shape-determining protein MreC [Lachnospiraceae bacterium]